MEVIFQALKHTPIWVYILFGVLLSNGLRATSERRVNFEHIFIFPSLLFVFSIYFMSRNFHLNFLSLLIWILGTLLGISLGFYNFQKLKVRFERKKNSFIIPGTMTTLFLIFVIFVSKYYFSYQIAKDPNLLNQKSFEFFMLSVSGFSSGCFVGRLIYCIKLKRITN